MKSPLSRRTLLRGAGQVAIALPFLDAMWSPRKAHAATPPRRLFTFFTENGVVERDWYPTGGVKDFVLQPNFKPMEAFRSNFIIFDGLDQMGDGSNGGGGHQRGKTGCLTGQSNNNGRAAGISIDQAIANHIGTGTRLKSVESSVHVKGRNRDGLFFSGPFQFIPAEDDPAKIFARLFSAPLPTTPAAGPNPAPGVADDFARLRARRKSVLDRTMDEFQRVQATLGGADRRKLDIHLEALRGVERSLGNPAASASAMPTMSCKKPDPSSETSFPTVGRAHIDLLAMALACDITRVVSLQWRSSETAFSWINVSSTHHGISHSQGSAGADAQLTKITTWFAGEANYALTRLKALGDAGGTTVLDNTLFYWTNELATGNHRRTRAPYLLVTGKFTHASGKPLETQRFLKYPGGTPHTSLLTSIANAMGLPIPNFGDSRWHKGPLPGLI